jgi:hypothetical protein
MDWTQPDTARSASLPPPSNAALLFASLAKEDWKAAISLLRSQPSLATKTSKTHDSQTPLHVAIRHLAPLSVIEVLLDLNPSAVISRDRYDCIPLHTASDFEFLTDVFSEKEKMEKASLALAVSLLPPSPTKKSQNSLAKSTQLLETSLEDRIASAKLNRTAIVERLLEVDPTTARLRDDNGRCPVHVAAWRRAPLRVVEMLLSAYPAAASKYTNDGNLPIHLAARKFTIDNKDSGKASSSHFSKLSSQSKGDKSPAKGSKQSSSSTPGRSKSPKPTKSPAKPQSSPTSRPPSRNAPSQSPSKLSRNSPARGGSPGRSSPRALGEESVLSGKQTLFALLHDAEACAREDLEGEESAAALEEIQRCEARLRNVFKGIRKAQLAKEKPEVDEVMVASKTEQQQVVKSDVEAEKQLFGEPEVKTDSQKREEDDGVKLARVGLKDAPIITSSSDPFIKILCKTINKRGKPKTDVLGKTRVIEKNHLNPKWNESFTISLKPDHERVVVLQLFDFDVVSGDDPMGCLVLNCDDPTSLPMGDEFLPLVSNPDLREKAVRGEIRIEAAFDPNASTLVLNIVEARDLAIKDKGDKVKVRADRKKHEKKPALHANLDILDLLLRFNLGARDDKDGLGARPQDLVKDAGAKVLLENSEKSEEKNLKRWDDMEGSEHVDLLMCDDTRMAIEEARERAIFGKRGGLYDSNTSLATTSLDLI